MNAENIKKNKYQIEKLIELVKENPNLPVIPVTCYEVIGGDWGYWYGIIENVEKDFFYINDEEWFSGEENIKEKIAKDNEDSCECEIMDDETFYSFVDNRFDEMVKTGEIQKSIIIFINT